MLRASTATIVAILFCLSVHVANAQESAGPLVAYDFSGGDGDGIVNNRGSLPGLGLEPQKAKAVRQRGSALELSGGKLVSESPPRELISAIKQSNELSIDVWLRPADTQQSGPARIITLSQDTSNRSFTLGQDKDRYDLRLRTTKTSGNGLPSLSTPAKSARKAWTHLVFTRSKNGETHLFVDGKPVARGKAPGTFSNWKNTDRFAIGDEVSGGRPWKGALRRIAIFARALSIDEVRQSFKAGPEATVPSGPSAEQLAAQHFESKIAPILAKHCLECHDIASAKGGLVLDRKQAAFAEAIVPGEAESSPLWLSIKTDDMPHDRAPLLTRDKTLLKEWIQSGAAWNLEWIDPADYVHEIGASAGYVRRLTVEEYVQSVKSAVGVDVGGEARAALPADLRADGFANTSYNLTVDLKHIEAYRELANKVTDSMDARAFAKRFWGKARLTDDDMRGLIQKMGAWILRGPLDDSEVDLFRGISTTVAASGGDYEAAVKATVAAMLQSPRFLYRMENQSEDGATPYLSDYALASRISFIVWGAPPDRKLLDAASDRKLSDPSEVRRQVSRMLQDPRALSRSRDFLTQWLNLNHLDSLRPDANRFQNWDAALARDMRDETLAFFEHIVWEQQRPLSDLLDAQVTFCSPRLARHYGLSNPVQGTDRYDLTNVAERGGLLTHGSVLTIGGDDASTVTRGLFVLNQLLRGVVNDPPPCVDTTPVPASPGSSARMIAEARIKNESCGGCHGRFEPLAFGLSKFDGLGSFHQTDEYGNRLRDDGTMLVPGTADAVDFQDSAAMMKTLADSDRIRESLVWRLTQYAIGRPPTSADAPVIRDIHRRSQKSGGTYQTILTEIVASRLVLPR
ncbi:MAG: DUF1592 domain-containing protein [Planctomycetota bacterium]